MKISKTYLPIITMSAVLLIMGCASFKKKESVQYEGSNLKTNGKEDPNVPVITAPSVRRVWVDDKIEGDKYIQGHYIYIIEKGSKWTKE